MTDWPDPLHRLVRSSPESEAIVAGDKRLSFRELDRRVANGVASLQSHGVAERELVALCAENSAELVIAVIALWRLGAVPVPISTRLPLAERRRLVAQVACSLLITSEGADDQAIKGAKAIRLADLQASDSDAVADAMPAPWPMTADASVIFTGGSSGEPRGVVHTFANHYWSALGANQNVPLASGDRWLLSLPIYHVGGLAILIRCLLAGAAVAIPSRGQSLWAVCEDLGVTHVSLVLTQLRRLLSESAGPPKGLRAALVGGGPFPEKLVREAAERGWPVYPTYGCTEMASQVATIGSDDSPRHLGSAGRVLRYRDVRIAGDGEILLRGPTLFKGYAVPGNVRRPDLDDGWYHSGDLGALDDDGYLRVLGRKDDLFVSGGENIHPQQIEMALMLLDRVAETVVVAVDDDEFGARPHAFVRFENSPALTAAEMRQQLRHHLPRFMIPDVIYRWPDLAAGSFKPSRSRLVELAREGQASPLS